MIAAAKSALEKAAEQVPRSQLCEALVQEAWQCLCPLYGMNCCIVAARMVRDILRAAGVECRAIGCDLTILNEAERIKLIIGHLPSSPRHRGHVVVLTDDAVVLDPTFPQVAFHAPASKLFRTARPLSVAFPEFLPGTSLQDHLQDGMVLALESDIGHIYYEFYPERSWFERCPAWHLDPIECVLMEQIADRLLLAVAELPD